METRDVTGTDLTIPRLSLGTMTFGGQVDDQEAGRILDLALAEGVTLVDTANVYAKGRSEEILGRLLKGRRPEVVLASKVGSPAASDGPPLQPQVMRRELTRSLQRLQTDYLDVYYLHRPDSRTPLAESLGTLDGFVKEGLVRYPAVSNYAAWQLALMHGMARERGWTPAVLSQPMYNLLARRIEDDNYLEASDHLGISNVVYNPLAGGLLTGKHRGPDAPVEGTRFGLGSYRDLYQGRYWNEQQFAGVEILKKVADDAGLSLIELAFRWLLSQQAVDSILVGVSSAEQLRQNLAACAGGLLPSDVLEACDAARVVVHGVAPTYPK